MDVETPGEEPRDVDEARRSSYQFARQVGLMSQERYLERREMPGYDPRLPGGGFVPVFSILWRSDE